MKTLKIIIQHHSQDLGTNTVNTQGISISERCPQFPFHKLSPHTVIPFQLSP